MEKIRFETDPHNRLIVTKTGLKGKLARFRRVLDGNFELAPGNTLAYHVKHPLDEYTLVGRQIKFNGTWRLNKNNDLVYTLDSWKGRVAEDELTLRCQVIDVKENALAVAVTTRSSKNESSVSLLTLTGAWHADKHNKLTFSLDSHNHTPQTLVFEGAWEVDKNNQLMYRYEKKDLVKGKRTSHTLRFKGHWDISDSARLGYVLETSPSKKPAFEFSGSWKITRSSALIFESRQQGGKVTSISLAARARLSDRNMIIITLKGAPAELPTAEFELNRRVIHGNGEAFLRLLASKGEQGVFLGVGRSW